MPRPPIALHDFIGQPRAVRHLRALVDGARMRSEAIISLLLIARSGMGKSLLAEAIAREYARSTGEATPRLLRRIMGGPRLISSLIAILVSLEHGDILFIDETHALDLESQEVLYLAVDEHKTFDRTPKGASDRTKTVSIAEFTLIAATTEPGKIAKPLRSRLHAVQLADYTLPELKAIAEKLAEAAGLDITPQGARHLAERSERTPRSVRKLIELLTVTMPKTTMVTQEVVRDFLAGQGIDEHGLTPLHRQMLQVLARADRDTSLDVLASSLGIDRLYVRTEVEPLLLELGLIELGTRGRSLTDRGRAIVRNESTFDEEPAESVITEVN